MPGRSLSGCGHQSAAHQVSPNKQRYAKFRHLIVDGLKVAIDLDLTMQSWSHVKKINFHILKKNQPKAGNNDSVLLSVAKNSRFGQFYIHYSAYKDLYALCLSYFDNMICNEANKGELG